MRTETVMGRFTYRRTRDGAQLTETRRYFVTSGKPRNVEESSRYERGIRVYENCENQPTRLIIVRQLFKRAHHNGTGVVEGGEMPLEDARYLTPSIGKTRRRVR